jgi:hypothetical protein
VRCDGRYLLYLSYEHPDDGRWRIDVLEANSIDELDFARRRTVLTPASTGTAAVKDPGISFEWQGTIFDVGQRWDRYQSRLSAIVRIGNDFVGLYDGSASAEEDTEERLGLASSPDLREWARISVDQPWLVSPHATGSLRHPSVLERGWEWWVYYECARADGSHELRMNALGRARSLHAE